MKKILTSVVLSVFALAFVATNVHAYTFPSTNEDNKNGTNPVRSGIGPHVNFVEATTDEVTLELVNPYSYAACFEYRADGESSQYGNIYPHPVIDGDFWYYYNCVTNGSEEITISATEYAEVRLAVGAERDWDFDWTRFDVLFNRYAEILSPEVGEIITSGEALFEAVLYDKDGNDNVQWAVRKGTCAAGQGTVYGNVDGFNNTYDWDGMNFSSETDVSSWDNGEYCFVFNPTESSGDTPVRETQEFAIANPPADKNQCKKGGWESLNDHLGNTFKNQGDCVSYVATDGKNLGSGPSIFE